MPVPLTDPGMYACNANIHIPFGSYQPNGRLSWWSPAYIGKATPHCLRFDTHTIRCALIFAADRAGSNNAAKIAMMAITTSNSISVKPDGNGELLFDFDGFKLGIGIGCE